MSFRTLQAGDLIAVVAPAGPATAEARAAAEALYARHGYRVRLYPGCAANNGYLAGSDATRLADLHAALADPEVAALHCLRGGYGTMRLLDGFDTALLRRCPKLLIGYSDITALQALWCGAGLPSLHAPMPASDLVKPGREQDEQALFALLRAGLRRGDRLTPALDPQAAAHGLHVGGRAAGRLIGGNLSLVAALVGTPWAWPAAEDSRGAILFLEDINEEVYRVDRLLTQLRLAGVLAAVGGFVLGRFSDAEAPTDLLRAMLLPLGKPLLAGWPSGHGTPNRPLPLGLKVELDADAATLTLREDFLA